MIRLLLCALLLPVACVRAPRAVERTWTPPRVAGDALLLAIAFPAQEFGVAVGGTTERGPSVVLRTEDEGATWNAIELDASGRLYDVDFPSAARGFAVGFGIALRTDDEGRTWQSLALPADRWLAAVDFVSKEKGFVVGGHGRDAVFWSTEDGGETWVDAVSRLPADARAALRDVHFVDASRGFVLGEQGLLCETLDAGATWSRIDTQTDAWLRSITVDGERAWIAASPGVLHSTDGARTWNALPTFATRKTTDVAFANERVGWVSSFDGTLFTTEDGGASWSIALSIDGTPTTLASSEGWWCVASDTGIYRLRRDP
ncbi:MAG: YCF48-related protein [Planctomycetota bacterium]